jgi:autotransporter-associated beta strand protein
MTRFLVTGGSSGFSGPVRVQVGELQGNVQFTTGTYTPFGTGANGLGSAMTIDSGAILSLWGGNNIGIALGSLAGSGTVRSESGAYTLRVGGDGTSTTFSGAITSGNALSLTKVGAGTLTLGGSSAYTGATQISAGALLVNGTLGATAVTVQSGGLLGGSGLIGGSVSVLAGGTFSPGNSPGLLTSGPLSLAGTTLMEIDGLAPRGGVGGYDAANINGLLTYGGSMLIDFGAGVTSAFADNTTFNLFSFTSQSNSFGGISTVSDGSFYAGLTFTNSGNNDKWTATKGSQTLEFTHSTGSLVIVPEPAAIALALSGIALGAGLRWRRRRAA